MDDQTLKDLHLKLAQDLIDYEARFKARVQALELAIKKQKNTQKNGSDNIVELVKSKKPEELKKTAPKKVATDKKKVVKKKEPKKKAQRKAKAQRSNNKESHKKSLDDRGQNYLDKKFKDSLPLKKKILRENKEKAEELEKLVLANAETVSSEVENVTSRKQKSLPQSESPVPERRESDRIKSRGEKPKVYIDDEWYEDFLEQKRFYLNNKMKNTKKAPEVKQQKPKKVKPESEPVRKSTRIRIPKKQEIPEQTQREYWRNKKRKSRAKIYANEDNHDKQLDKQRQYYMKKKENGLVFSISMLPPDAQDNKRREWRESQSKFRRKRKAYDSGDQFSNPAKKKKKSRRREESFSDPLDTGSIESVGDNAIFITEVTPDIFIKEEDTDLEEDSRILSAEGFEFVQKEEDLDEVDAQDPRILSAEGFEYIQKEENLDQIEEEEVLGYTENPVLGFTGTVEVNLPVENIIEKDVLAFGESESVSLRTIPVEDIIHKEEELMDFEETNAMNLPVGELEDRRENVDFVDFGDDMHGQSSSDSEQEEDVSETNSKNLPVPKLVEKEKECDVNSQNLESESTSENIEKEKEDTSGFPETEKTSGQSLTDKEIDEKQQEEVLNAKLVEGEEECVDENRATNPPSLSEEIFDVNSQNLGSESTSENIEKETEVTSGLQETEKTNAQSLTGKEIDEKQQEEVLDASRQSRLSEEVLDKETTDRENIPSVQTDEVANFENLLEKQVEKTIKRSCEDVNIGSQNLPLGEVSEPVQEKDETKNHSKPIEDKEVFDTTSQNSTAEDFEKANEKEEEVQYDEPMEVENENLPVSDLVAEEIKVSDVREDREPEEEEKENYCTVAEEVKVFDTNSQNLAERGVAAEEIEEQGTIENVEPVENEKLSMPELVETEKVLESREEKTSNYYHSEPVEDTTSQNLIAGEDFEKEETAKSTKSMEVEDKNLPTSDLVAEEIKVSDVREDCEPEEEETLEEEERILNANSQNSVEREVVEEESIGPVEVENENLPISEFVEKETKMDDIRRGSESSVEETRNHSAPKDKEEVSETSSQKSTVREVVEKETEKGPTTDNFEPMEVDKENSPISELVEQVKEVDEVRNSLEPENIKISDNCEFVEDFHTTSSQNLAVEKVVEEETREEETTENVEALDEANPTLSIQEQVEVNVASENFEPEEEKKSHDSELVVEKEFSDSNSPNCAIEEVGEKETGEEETRKTLESIEERNQDSPIQEFTEEEVVESDVKNGCEFEKLAEEEVKESKVAEDFQGIITKEVEEYPRKSSEVDEKNETEEIPKENCEQKEENPQSFTGEQLESFTETVEEEMVQIVSQENSESVKNSTETNTGSDFEKMDTTNISNDQEENIESGETNVTNIESQNEEMIAQIVPEENFELVENLTETNTGSDFEKMDTTNISNDQEENIELEETKVTNIESQNEEMTVQIVPEENSESVKNLTETNTGSDSERIDTTNISNDQEENIELEETKVMNTKNQNGEMTTQIVPQENSESVKNFTETNTAPLEKIATTNISNDQEENIESGETSVTNIENQKEEMTAQVVPQENSESVENSTETNTASDLEKMDTTNISNDQEENTESGETKVTNIESQNEEMTTQIVPQESSESVKNSTETTTAPDPEKIDTANTSTNQEKNIESGETSVTNSENPPTNSSKESVEDKEKVQEQKQVDESLGFEESPTLFSVFC